MQARFDRSGRTAGNLRDLFEREVLEEVEHQDLPVTRLQLIERPVHLGRLCGGERLGGGLLECSVWVSSARSRAMSCRVRSMVTARPMLYSHVRTAAGSRSLRIPRNARSQLSCSASSPLSRLPVSLMA